MATPSSMIIRGLQMLGDKAIGGTLTSGEQTTYLEVLNAMLESWSVDSLMCFQEIQENFALTSGIGTYTIGAGGAFNTTRPIKIVSVFIRDTANVDYPLEVINDDAWNNIRLKTVAGTYPSYLYYNKANISGRGTINLYPLPTSGLTLYISTLRQLLAFATIGETVSLPPGYQRAIESNFAIEVSPGYKAASNELIKIAKDSKAAIKQVNAPSPILRMPGGRAGNILIG